MTKLQVCRWRRYCKDRVYVTTDQGDPVGWQDLLTDQVVVERSDLQEAFHAAVAAFRRDPASRTISVDIAPAAGLTIAQGRMVPALEAPSLSGAADVHACPDDLTDLAENVPGQAARHQADRSWAAAKDRGLLRAVLARAIDSNSEERSWRVGAAPPALSAVVVHGRGGCPDPLRSSAGDGRRTRHQRCRDGRGGNPLIARLAVGLG